MEYTSRKKRSTRMGVRIIGCLFCLGAVLYIVHSLISGITGINMIFSIVSLVFIAVGISYLKQSFAVTAYDITYYIKPECLLMKTYRGDKRIAYEDIKDISISKVSQDMEYYVIHILAEKYNLVIHILDDGVKAQSMYQLLLEFSGLNEETSK